MLIQNRISSFLLRITKKENVKTFSCACSYIEWQLEALRLQKRHKNIITILMCHTNLLKPYSSFLCGKKSKMHIIICLKSYHAVFGTVARVHEKSSIVHFINESCLSQIFSTVRSQIRLLWFTSSTHWLYYLVVVVNSPLEKKIYEWITVSFVWSSNKTIIWL